MFVTSSMLMDKALSQKELIADKSCIIEWVGHLEVDVTKTVTFYFCSGPMCLKAAILMVALVRISETWCKHQSPDLGRGDRSQSIPL